MIQTGRIVGLVEYRGGDGPAVEIREGPVEIAMSETDVTLSWTSGDTHGSAALPIGDFRRFVEEGKILLEKPEPSEG